MATLFKEPTLGQAALIAGIGLLAVSIFSPFAQFYAFPSLFDPSDVARTVNNFSGRRDLFLAGIFAYLANYIVDIIVAWALYLFLKPVSKAISQLALLTCLTYVAMAFVAVFNYVEAYRLLVSPEVNTALTETQLNTQFYLLVSSYQFDWGFSLFVFGVVLLIRGYLVMCAPFVPTVYGILLAAGGFGYIVYLLGLYLTPSLDLRLLTLTFLCEPIFMVWLIFRGRGVVDS